MTFTKNLLVASILITASIASFDANAQTAANRNGGMVTRDFKQMSDLEQQCLQAATSKDPNALAQMLSEDFQLRSANLPEDSTNRSEFLKQYPSDLTTGTQLEHVTLHTHGSVNVTSFILTVPVIGAGSAHRYYVVDTWKQHDKDWRLITRHVAPLGEDSKVPGAVAHAPSSKKI